MASIKDYPDWMEEAKAEITRDLYALEQDMAWKRLRELWERLPRWIRGAEAPSIQHPPGETLEMWLGILAKLDVLTWGHADGDADDDGEGDDDGDAHAHVVPIPPGFGTIKDALKRLMNCAQAYRIAEEEHVAVPEDSDAFGAFAGHAETLDRLLEQAKMQVIMETFSIFSKATAKADAIAEGGGALRCAEGYEARAKACHALAIRHVRRMRRRMARGCERGVGCMLLCEEGCENWSGACYSACEAGAGGTSRKTSGFFIYKIAELKKWR